MQRLHPAPVADVRAIDLYDVERPRHHDGRPWVGICMVSSLDGSTVVDGASSGLSNPNDTDVLLTLRRLADVIVVGAGTVRAEGYGAPSTPGQRIGVVTETGALDVGTDLFTTGSGFLICPDSTPDRGVETLRAGRHTVDLAAALGRLDEVVPDVAFVQAEGGARLNGALIADDLVDELNLSISSRLVGGNGPRLAAGGGQTRADFDLAHLAIDDQSFLFSRWVRRRAC